MASKSLNKKQHTSWFILAFLLIIGLGVGGLYITRPTLFSWINPQARQATEQIQQLYADEQKVYLNSGISLEDIDRAQQAVDQVSGSQRQALQEDLNTIKAKYEGIRSLSEIYDVSGPLILSNEAAQGLPLRPGITLADIEKKDHTDQFKKRDALVDQISELFATAKMMARSFESAKEHIAQLRDLPLGSEGDVRQFKEHVDKITQDIMPLKNQPNYHESLGAELDTVLKDGVSKIVALNSQQALQSDVVEGLMSDQLIGPYVSGTSLDQRKLVALTFDDGPHPNTYEVLEVLDEYGIKATFFHLGKWVDMYPEITKEVVTRGHEIGNHSYSHPDFSTIADGEVLNEMQKTQDIIEKACGVVPTRYRMPFGSGGARVIQMFPELSSVMWNVDSQDWQSQDSKTIYRHTVETMLPHSVVLFHETIPATVDALRQIIPELQAEGYEFVTLDEISYDYLNEGF